MSSSQSSCVFEATALSIPLSFADNSSRCEYGQNRAIKSYKTRVFPSVVPRRVAILCVCCNLVQSYGLLLQFVKLSISLNVLCEATHISTNLVHRVYELRPIFSFRRRCLVCVPYLILKPHRGGLEEGHTRLVFFLYLPFLVKFILLLGNHLRNFVLTLPQGVFRGLNNLLYRRLFSRCDAFVGLPLFHLKFSYHLINSVQLLLRLIILTRLKVIVLRCGLGAKPIVHKAPPLCLVPSSPQVCRWKVVSSSHNVLSLRLKLLHQGLSLAHQSWKVVQGHSPLTSLVKHIIPLASKVLKLLRRCFSSLIQPLQSLAQCYSRTCQSTQCPNRSTEFS